MRLLTGKKGLSPVIASIILCSAVIIIGLSVWSFTYSVTNVLSESYCEGVQEQIETISERFTVENVAYDGTLHVWVYNYGNITDYGDIDILVKLYVRRNKESVGTTEWTTVPSGEVRKITVSLDPPPSEGSELIIQVTSQRGNDAYETYVVVSV